MFAFLCNAQHKMVNSHFFDNIFFVWLLVCDKSQSKAILYNLDAWIWLCEWRGRNELDLCSSSSNQYYTFTIFTVLTHSGFGRKFHSTKLPKATEMVIAVYFRLAWPIILFTHRRAINRKSPDCEYVVYRIEKSQMSPISQFFFFELILQFNFLPSAIDELVFSSKWIMTIAIEFH